MDCKSTGMIAIHDILVVVTSIVALLVVALVNA